MHGAITLCLSVSKHGIVLRAVDPFLLLNVSFNVTSQAQNLILQTSRPHPAKPSNHYFRSSIVLPLRQIIPFDSSLASISPQPTSKSLRFGSRLDRFPGHTPFLPSTISIQPSHTRPSKRRRNWENTRSWTGERGMVSTKGLEMI